MELDTNQIRLIFRWEVREETPEQIAARFVSTIDWFRLQSPDWNQWTSGPGRPLKFELARKNYADVIAGGVIRDDWGEAEPYYGYDFFAITRRTSRERLLSVSGRASNTLEKFTLPNQIKIRTDDYAAPDLSIFNISFMKNVMYKIIELWSPDVGLVETRGLVDSSPSGYQYFEKCWMEYLAAEPAAMITPPASAFVERLANGGLIMSATQDPFDLDNPIHMAAVDDIAAASAPLNERWDAQYYHGPRPKDADANR